MEQSMDKTPFQARILIVEDELHMRQALKKCLEGEGVSCYHR